MNDDLPLGRPVAHPTRYDPSVLRAIERAPARAAIGLDAPLPFGEDVWNGYELSWLGPGGLPRVGVATVRVPCGTPRIVESKSLKLYLGGFAQTVFPGKAEVAAAIGRDVEEAVGAPVSAAVCTLDALPKVADFRSFCLDGLNVPIAHYQVRPELLAGGMGEGADAVHTHLFRSLCPVTGQPDLGSIRIAWRGRALNRAGLLAYLVSYRQSVTFHEHAVERIFVDVRRAAAATELVVEGRFLRRGGIDINPLRATSPQCAAAARLPRQPRLPRQ